MQRLLRGIHVIGRKPWRLGLAAGVLVTVGGGAGLAIASIPGSDGVIHGCYLNKIGTLRVIDPGAGQKCASVETAIQWNQSGPQGPQGTVGPAGPANTQVQHVTMTLTPGEFAFIVARCSPGQVATGGGYGSNSESLSFTENSPSPSDGTPTAWVVGALNTSTAGADVQAVAYVICAPTSAQSTQSALR
jgi:hypothetical protein